MSDVIERELTDREQARKRVEKKHKVRGDVVTYAVINMFLIGIWAISGTGFFWPAFVLGGWGIGLAANAWEVYGRKPISESEIQRETERLRD
ncbi:MAG: 2TM domain-containing protein [Solirubrobacterales bacterium]